MTTKISNDDINVSSELASIVDSCQVKDDILTIRFCIMRHNSQVSIKGLRVSFLVSRFLKSSAVTMITARGTFFGPNFFIGGKHSDPPLKQEVDHLNMEKSAPNHLEKPLHPPT